MNKLSEKVNPLWNVADQLRGEYLSSEYGRVILPFLILRRLDQVIAPTRVKVWEANQKFRAGETSEALREQMLQKAAGQSFYNVSRLDYEGLLADTNHIADNLRGYINGFSANVRDILEKFRFKEQIQRLERANLLSSVARQFAAVDLHPERVSAEAVGLLFRELFCKFCEQFNDTAGEYFTPRDVVRFMINLLLLPDSDLLRKPQVHRTIYDPACGTGGLLAAASTYLHQFNSEAKLNVFGQDISEEACAICKADLLVKGEHPVNIMQGDSFSHDRLPDLKADYLISNPPFGLDWSRAEEVVIAEHRRKGFAGRFGPGLPRKNDGSMLFLLHMISKMKPADQGGSRLAIIFNGSPLITGAAGSGESEIRRWILENDWLEAIVALPDQMFYNTGISTYVWVLSNRKSQKRRGKVQLINGVSYYNRMRSALGNKRKEFSQEQIEQLTQMYSNFSRTPDVKICDNEEFGFREYTIERPLQLNFRASQERLARLEQNGAWRALRKPAGKGESECIDPHTLQESIRAALNTLDPTRLYLSRVEFTNDLKNALQGLAVTPSLMKAILISLSERDESAELCTSKGVSERDPQQRICERVPLKVKVDNAAASLVNRYPNSWVDASATKVGYRIDFAQFKVSRYQKLASQAGIVLTPLTKAARSYIRGTQGTAFADRANSVYIPDSLSRTAETQLDSTSTRPESWIQVALDESVADARFFTAFLNSELGRAYRESIQLPLGLTARTELQSLRDSQVYLPSLQEQLSFLDVHARLRELQSELVELETRLLNKPSSTNEIRQKAKQLGSSDSLDSWLESLPFPLASILWAYHAAPDPKSQYERLFFFFEAWAAFAATILLSAFQSHRGIKEIDEAIDALHRALDQGKQNLKIAQFGTWITVIRCLRSKAEKLFRSPQVEFNQLATTMFATENRLFLEAVLSNQILKNLETANKLRNDFSGHGGIVGTDEAVRRHSAAREILLELRSAWGLAWDGFELICPVDFSHKSGIFMVTYQRVMGTRTPFARSKASFSHLLETDSLYLYDQVSGSALPLLPFVRMESSPQSEKNACYFFNRLDKAGVRFVSYHFEKEPEIVHDFVDTRTAIDTLLEPSASPAEQTMETE